MLSDHDVYTSAGELARLETRDMVLIPGNEVTANGSHILHVNASRLVAPYPERPKVREEIMGDPASFAIICHPNWAENFDHTSLEQLRDWREYTGLEIYNGVVERLEGSAICTNKWDMLLSGGKCVWGYANDDSHAADGDVGLGWNMVYAEEKSARGILDSLRRGRCYASTGVRITGIRVEGASIRIESENADRIVALQRWAKRFAKSEGNVLEVTVEPGMKYVRFECYGRGGAMAWTQPFFLSEE
jgi:hypothetical protein